MKHLTILCFSGQTLYLGKFCLTSYRPKYFHPIRLQDFLTINVTGRNASFLFFSCRYSLRKCSTWDYSWLGMSRHVQPHSDLLRLPMSAFGWCGGITRLKIVQNKRSIDSLGNGRVFSSIQYSAFLSID